jgi:crossover junction endodeoxyribonuclease RuvC
MILLGIDPGSAAVGYGVIEQTGARLRAVAFGCHSTSPDEPLPVRLQTIHRQVATLLVEHRPSIVAVERLFFSRNAQTAFAVGQARGVVLLAAAEAGVDVAEATPSAIKLAVAGYGRADKEQLGRMVATILGLPETPRPDDAADALAAAIWCAHLAPAGEPARAPVLDRAAVPPLARGQTPYERAVRDALRGAAVGAAQGTSRPARDRGGSRADRMRPADGMRPADAPRP